MGIPPQFFLDPFPIIPSNLKKNRPISIWLESGLGSRDNLVFFPPIVDLAPLSEVVPLFILDLDVFFIVVLRSVAVHLLPPPFICFLPWIVDGLAPLECIFEKCAFIVPLL